MYFMPFLCIQTVCAKFIWHSLNGLCEFSFVTKEETVKIKKIQPAFYFDGKKLGWTQIDIIQRRLFGDDLGKNKEQKHVRDKDLEELTKKSKTSCAEGVAEAKGVPGDVSEIRELRFIRVETEEQMRIWNEMMTEGHPRHSINFIYPRE